MIKLLNNYRWHAAALLAVSLIAYAWQHLSCCRIHQQNRQTLIEFLKYAQAGSPLVIAVDIHDVVVQRMQGGDLTRLQKVPSKARAIAALVFYTARFGAYMLGVGKRPVLETYVLANAYNGRQQLIELISPYTPDIGMLEALRTLKHTCNVPVMIFSNIGQESLDYFVTTYASLFDVFDDHCIPAPSNNYAFKSDDAAHRHLHEVSLVLLQGTNPHAILFFDDKQSNLTRCKRVISKQNATTQLLGYRFTTTAKLKADLADAYQQVKQ